MTKKNDNHGLIDLDPVIKKIPLSKLVPADYNPRKISDKELAGLQKSLERFGLQEVIVWNKRSGRVVGGHQRLRIIAAMATKSTRVPVAVVDLPEKEEKLLNVTLNNPHIQGEFDDEKLAALREAMPIFRDQKILEELRLERLFPVPADVEEDDFDPALPKTPKSKLGEAYELGTHRLMCGDSTKREHVEKLMDGAQAEMIFTDPPYGMNLDTDFSKMPRGENTYDKVIGDDSDFDASFLFEIKGIIKWYIWGADWFYLTLPKGASPIVWDKQPQNAVAGPQNHFELCWAYPNEKRRIIRKLWTGYTATETNETRLHPTQKPLSVCADIMGRGDKIVLDLFGGSGSTLIAAEATGRTCYMMEIEPRYCDMIRDRYAAYVKP